MKKHIAVVPGDGIGPEIVKEAIKVLDCIAEKYDHEFTYTHVIAGGCAIDQFGKSLPEESLQQCLNSDSVLLGAVGGPKWDDVDPSIRPEKALLGIRKELGLYANLRPAKIFPQLADASPLRQDIVAKGIDFMVDMLYSEDAKTIKEDARRRYHGIHQRHRKGMRGLGGYREQGAERSQRYQSGHQRKSA